MKVTRITCPQCGKDANKPNGAVARARKVGLPVYCSMACFRLSKRHWKPDDQKRREKAAYDAEYRRKNRKMLKRKKAEYFQRTYDPEQARVERKKKARQHAEYCRRPEYKEYKREYDKVYRARKEYGEYAECFILTMEIRNECLTQQSDYEIRQSKGTLNKRLQRKRDYERAYSNQPETGSLGNPGPLA